jgi:UDP-N-acetylmuramoylalanine--D-glutamate ligase
MREWAGHLLVLGLGASGEAAADWALDRAAAGAAVEVTVVDSDTAGHLAERAERLRARGARVLLGSDELPAADLVVTSPGIPPKSAIMRSARALGVPLISEIELAYRISRAPWVAVTGTNGKTTTTALIVHLLREAGFAAEPAGNIGPPAVRVAADVGPAAVIVAEVSSFQLSAVESFHPAVAVLLNVTPDHLDYHGSMEAYAADKARIFANQLPGDVAVIDVDDAGARAMVPVAEARGASVIRVSRETSPVPGACLREGVLVLNDGTGVKDVLPVSELAIRGDHNVSNALAAAAAVSAMGADIASIRRGLVSFAPLEHRLEPAGVVDGVEYFNDSKATNPDAVAKALTAFQDRHVVLLLGGRNKGVDLAPLAALAAERCEAVVLFGEAAAELADAFAPHPIAPRRVSDLAAAVRAAHEIAAPGDVVVLSPGCTSFDEFTSYTERGRRFKALVAELGGGDRS